MLQRLLCLTLLALTPVIATGLDLDSVLANMDRAAAGFESMQATITRLKYMALLDEKTTESGEIFVRKDKDGSVRLLINFKEPSAATRRRSTSRASLGSRHTTSQSTGTRSNRRSCSGSGRPPTIFARTMNFACLAKRRQPDGTLSSWS